PLRSPIGRVKTQPACAVKIARAHTAAPLGEIDARLPGYVFELPSSEIAIEGVAMRHAVARRRELRSGDEINGAQTITVVVEQGAAAARRFEDVILARTAAIHLPGQLRTD